jgi:hypothetical protein
MIDKLPSAVTKEGVEPQTDIWPKVKKPIPLNERKVYPGAGSELFHGIKKG